MATELIDIELDEISLVDKGDDPEAKIALFKRALTKRIGEAELDASSFAYAPDTSDPNTWILPLNTMAHVDAAVEALGKRNKIPFSDRRIVKSRVRDAWRQCHGPDAELPSTLKRGPIDMILEVLKGDGDAHSFDEAIDQTESRRAVFQSMDKLWEMFQALQCSVESIMTDDEVTDKPAAVQASITQFSEALRDALPMVQPIAASGDTGDDTMADEALKQQVQELQKKLEDEVAARKISDDALEKLRAETDGGDTGDMTKDLPEDVRKRIEAQDVEIAKLREERETEHAKAHLAEIAKASPGVSDEAFVKGYRALDDDAREALDKVLKSGSEAHAQLQKEVGKDGEELGLSALDRATEEAKKLMADKPSEFSTLAKARAHVWKMNPDLKAEYAAERSQAH